MLLNAIEEQKRATPLWIFACQPPRGDRDQKMAGGSVQMRHIILFSIAAVARRCCGVGRHLNSVSKNPNCLAVRPVLPRGEGKEFTHSGVARSEYVAE
jgi:hypothetical protein